MSSDDKRGQMMQSFAGHCEDFLNEKGSHCRVDSKVMTNYCFYVLKDDLLCHVQDNKGVSSAMEGTVR